MKKLILLLFLIPNLVMAETWVCSYLMNGEIQTSTFKRLNDKQFITTGGSKNRLYYEDDKSITLKVVNISEMDIFNIIFVYFILGRHHFIVVKILTAVIIWKGK